MTTSDHTPTPDQEQLLSIVAGALVAGCVAVWAAGQIAARVWNCAWLPVSPWESPIIVVRLATDPARPADAWPPEVMAQIPDPVAYYTVLAILCVVTCAIVAIVWSGSRCAGNPWS